MTYVERKSSLKDRSLPHLVDLSELSDRGRSETILTRQGREVVVEMSANVKRMKIILNKIRHLCQIGR